MTEEKRARKRAYDRVYNRTDRAKEARLRWARSEHGKARRRAAEKKWLKTESGRAHLARQNLRKGAKAKETVAAKRAKLVADNWRVLLG